jgi:NADH dehydrogenase
MMGAVTQQHKVVIVGGGFGGLALARSLGRAPVDVTLVDRHNYHLFQPLLYQVATGGLSPANIASPLRTLVKRQRNVRVLCGNVDDIDVERRRVLVEGATLEYDTLVLAAGSSHSYFGHDEWASYAPGLKTIDDATAIRRRILEAFEIAEWYGECDDAQPWMTFAVVGGGPTGVELVGQIAEIAHHTMVREFRSIDPRRAKAYLIEAGDRILPAYDIQLSWKAQRDLEAMGVTVLVDSMVIGVDDTGVRYKSKGKEQHLDCRSVFWGAGVQASPLARKIGDATGATIDRTGRVAVEPNLSLAGHSDIFVIGDMANCTGSDGKPLPALAPVAMQQGKYLANVLHRWIEGRPAPPPFRYHDRGTLATIGRSRAVAQLPFGRFSGVLAWWMWLIIHLMTLVEFQNRILVLVQWGWAYVTRNRAARLITGQTKLNDDDDPLRHALAKRSCPPPEALLVSGVQSAILSKKP